MRFLRFLLAFNYGIVLTYLVFFARRRRNLPHRYLNTMPIKNTILEFVVLDPNSFKDQYNFYTNLLGNIVLLIPFIIFIYLITGIDNSKKLIFASLYLSLFIEIMQYSFKLGVADIDDVILNTVGAMIGVLIIKLIKNYSQIAVN